MSDEPGCLGTLLIGAGVVVLGGIAARKVVLFLAPYWPLSVLIALVVWVAVIVWLVCRVLGRWLAPWRERRRVQRETELAKAEIRGIHRETVRRMERVRRGSKR